MILPTSPRVWQDNLLWPILAKVFEPFSRKNAHWWHYYNAPMPEHWIPRLSLTEDRDAINRYGNLWNMFWATNFGDPNVVVLGPAFQPLPYHYQIGYVARVNNRLVVQRCSIVLNSLFGFILTDHPVGVWAESWPEREPIRLRVSHYTTRKQLAAHIPLL